MVIFQYNLYIFGIHLRTVLFPKPCYNKPCYKEAEVYFFFSVSSPLEMNATPPTGQCCSQRIAPDKVLFFSNFFTKTYAVGRGHLRRFGEGEVLRQFQDFREVLDKILDFPLHHNLFITLLLGSIA